MQLKEILETGESEVGPEKHCLFELDTKIGIRLFCQFQSDRFENADGEE